jgi:hypothetical protein
MFESSIAKEHLSNTTKTLLQSHPSVFVGDFFQFLRIGERWGKVRAVDSEGKVRASRLLSLLGTYTPLHTQLSTLNSPHSTLHTQLSTLLSTLLSHTPLTHSSPHSSSHSSPHSSPHSHTLQFGDEAELTTLLQKEFVDWQRDVASRFHPQTVFVFVTPTAFHEYISPLMTNPRAKEYARIARKVRSMRG